MSSGLTGPCHASNSAHDRTRADIVARHDDWREPLVLAPAPFREAAQSSSTPALIRRFNTARRLLQDGGPQAGWTRRSVHAATSAAARFKPDVIWATFGKMESIFAARRIAQQLQVPWVLDLKDNWEVFVPRGIRQLMAWRVRGWSALTANAEFTRAQGLRLHGGDAQLVYSGVDDAFMARPENDRPDPSRFVINLVGSLYFPERLIEVLNGIGAWAAALSGHDRGRVDLHYLGGDVLMLREALSHAHPGVTVHEDGYLAPDAMARACRRACVNAYVRHTGSFHHKLLELLACDRPVLVFPGEGEESRDIVRQVGGLLLEPASGGAIAAELHALHRAWKSGACVVPSSDCRPYSWPAQTLVLQEALSRVARNGSVRTDSACR